MGDSPINTDGVETNINIQSDVSSEPGAQSIKLMEYGNGSNLIIDDDQNDENDEELYNNKGFYVRVLADYIDEDEEQLDLKQDGILFIIQTTESGWWYGIDEDGLDGWIPSNYVTRCNVRRQTKQQTKQTERRNKETDDGQMYVLFTELMDKSYNNIINNNLMNQININKFGKMPPRICPVMTNTTTNCGGIDDISS